MDKENQNEPNTVDEILRKIEKKADTGEYLHRGEPEHYQEAPYYGKVSSNLYRVCLEDEEFDVEACTACTWYRDNWTEDRIILRTATLT